MRSILLVAAENSAENYATRVVEAFGRRHPDVRFFGVGGEQLASAGMEITVPNRELAVVGILEVVSSLSRLRRAMGALLDEARERRAEAALLVDYPDFNLRLARRLHRRGVRVYYFISPTVWAWRYRRVEQIRRYVDHLFIIFPFEAEIYGRERIPHTYVGHPLLPLVKTGEPSVSVRTRLGVKEGERLLALLPGSRNSEVRALLPVMLGAWERLRSRYRLRAAMLQARNVDETLFAGCTAAGISLLPQAQGYDLLQAADLALSSCGTSNLEAALLGTPLVVAYRVNRLSYLLGRRLVKIDRYSIVNILAGKPVVTELIQRDCRSERLAEEAARLLDDPAAREEMLAEFRRICSGLEQQHEPAELIRSRIAADLDWE
jgi:lipid-A-disaccharide synthase